MSSSFARRCVARDVPIFLIVPQLRPEQGRRRLRHRRRRRRPLASFSTSIVIFLFLLAHSEKIDPLFTSFYVNDNGQVHVYGNRPEASDPTKLARTSLLSTANQPAIEFVRNDGRGTSQRNWLIRQETDDTLTCGITMDRLGVSYFNIYILQVVYTSTN